MAKKNYKRSKLNFDDKFNFSEYKNGKKYDNLSLASKCDYLKIYLKRCGTAEISVQCSCYVKTYHFSEKACLLKLSDKVTGAVSLWMFLSFYCWVWVNTTMLRLGNKDVFIMYLLLFLCHWCWFWASIYCWKADSFMWNLLCFIPQLIFNFTTWHVFSTPSSLSF